VSVKSVCGNCMAGRHDACHDGLTPGLIGGWYCGCDHTPETEHAQAAAVLRSLIGDEVVDEMDRFLAAPKEGEQ
jgi:hypothetical protein